MRVPRRRRISKYSSVEAEFSGRIQGAFGVVSVVCRDRWPFEGCVNVEVVIAFLLISRCLAKSTDVSFESGDLN
jgi:hypothetical protein